MFDLVITNDAAEKEKITKPNEAFQLQNGSTYTYVNSFSKDFRFDNPTVRTPNARATVPSTSSSSITRESLRKPPRPS